MDLASPYVWIPVAVGALGLLIGAFIYSSRKRTREMRAFAVALGFRSARKFPLSKGERKCIPLFRRGYSRTFSNVYANDLGVVLGDYEFKFGMPLIASLRYRQTFLLFPAANTGIPDFQLSPATSVDKAAMKLGLGHVHIDGAPEFSRRYLIRATDALLLAARLMPIADQLLALDPAVRLFVEKGGNRLVLYTQGVMIAPQQLGEFWERAQQIVALLLLGRAAPVGNT